MSKKPGRHYVNNRDFLAAILEYKKLQELAREERWNMPPPIPKYCGECLYLICTRMASRPNFCGYSFRDEMVSAALLNLVEAFNNFDPYNYSNPFGYFSQIAWRAMIRIIRDEKKQTAIKFKSAQRSFTLDELREEGLTTLARARGEASDLVGNEVISKFEESLAKKRVRKTGVEQFLVDEEDVDK